MARKRGRAWGNALGGWRKQRRKGNGQFGSGGGGTAKKASRAAKAGRKGAKTKRRTKKAAKKAQRKTPQSQHIRKSTIVGGAAGTLILPGVGTAVGALVGRKVAQNQIASGYDPRRRAITR